MKKVITLLLGLVASTASFAFSANASELTSQSRVVITKNQKVRLYVNPVSSKGQLAICDVKGHSLYYDTVALKMD